MQGAFAAGFSMVNANKVMFIQRFRGNHNLDQLFDEFVKFDPGILQKNRARDRRVKRSMP
jgi:hypothetical protein